MQISFGSKMWENFDIRIISSFEFVEYIAINSQNYAFEFVWWSLGVYVVGVLIFEKIKVKSISHTKVALVQRQLKRVSYTLSVSCGRCVYIISKLVPILHSFFIWFYVKLFLYGEWV